MTKYRVSYTVGSERYACEYASRSEADQNHQDIAGYEGVFDVRTDGIHSDEPPNRGPFSLMVPTAQSRYDRSEVLGDD